LPEVRPRVVEVQLESFCDRPEAELSIQAMGVNALLAGVELDLVTPIGPSDGREVPGSE